MMNQFKTWMAVMGAVLLAVIATYFITNYFAESKIEYVRDNAQQRIDSISVVKQAAIANRDAIEDSLRALDETFAKYVTRTEQEINSYTTIIGSLRLQKDRLRDSTRTLSAQLALTDIFGREYAAQSNPADTSISKVETWTDSLFATTATAIFRNDSLYLGSDLRQLRDIRLDLATTVSEDRRQVNVFVRSPDFDSLNVHSITEIRPEKNKPWGWFLGGTIAIIEALRLIF